MSLVLFDATSRTAGRPKPGETPSGRRPTYPLAGGLT